VRGRLPCRRSPPAGRSTRCRSRPRLSSDDRCPFMRASRMVASRARRRVQEGATSPDTDLTRRHLLGACPRCTTGTHPRSRRSGVGCGWTTACARYDHERLTDLDGPGAVGVNDVGLVLECSSLWMEHRLPGEARPHY
jgi:hypothetical protein